MSSKDRNTRSDFSRWTYGANRIQVEADKKILTDFLSLLQTDAVRASHTISSMNNPSCKERHPGKPFISSCCQFPLILLQGMKGANHLLRLLVDNEIYRLSVWDNPSNDPHRGIDHNGSTEKGIMDVRIESLIKWLITEIEIHRIRGWKKSEPHGRSILHW